MKSGGFLNQLKEGTIQSKITENAKKEQAQFNAEILLDKINNNLKKSAKENITQKKSYKTLIAPILQKRLS